MKKGTLFGLSSGLLWGLSTVIIGIILSYGSFVAIGDKGSLLATLTNDTVSFVILLLMVIIGGNFKKFVSVIKSKSGLIIIIASLFAAPLGMTGYILSIKYLNASIAASLSAIYPLVGMVLAFLILREKTRIHGIIGILISVTAIILMGVTNYSKIDNFLLGMFFSLLCIFGWGAEAVIIGYALKDDVDPIVALTIRQMTSSIVYLIIILPFIGYSNMSIVFSDFKIPMFILFGAFAGTASYLLYYKSIDNIGAGKAMALNVSYPAWAFFFTVIIYREFSLISFILSIFIIIGTLLSIDNPMELLPFDKIKKETL